MKIYKKILYFLDFPLYVGGSNKVLLTQAFIMKQKGYQVKIVIPTDEDGIYTMEYDKICDSYGLDRRTAYYEVAVCMEEINIVAALEQYEAVVKIIYEEQPDLIHSTQLNITVELAARELTIPHLMNIYQTDRQTFHIDWMNIYPMYHSADSIMMSERWGGGLGIASRCIRVAYKSGIRKIKKNKNSRSNKICILSIGILCVRKNQLECLKFIRKCRDNGYCGLNMILIGENKSEYGDLCRKYVEENGLQGNVQFKGFVSNVDDYLADADLLIVASTVESYPGVIVESMANKVAVLSTPVAGVPELLKDEVNGFLTDGYEASDLYETFQRYLEYRKSGKISQIIENAYSTYIENHTYESVGIELEKYYQWIVTDYQDKAGGLLPVHCIRQKITRIMCEKKGDMTKAELDKIWLLYHILHEIERSEGKKVLIWGAGFLGKIVFEWLDILTEQMDFVGFIDSHKQGKCLGFPIFKNEDSILDECSMVIVAIGDVKSRLWIMDYLEEKGMERNKDYFLLYNGAVRL